MPRLWAEVIMTGTEEEEEEEYMLGLLAGEYAITIKYVSMYSTIEGNI